MKISMHVPTQVAMNFPEPPDGIKIEDKKQIFQFDSEGFSTLNLVINISSGASASLLAAWLYDKFIKKEKETQKERSIKINETVLTSVTKDSILQEVKRQYEYHDKS